MTPILAPFCLVIFLLFAGISDSATRIVLEESLSPQLATTSDIDGIFPKSELPADFDGLAWKGIAGLADWTVAIATNENLRTRARFRDEAFIPFIVKELDSPALTNAMGKGACPESHTLMRDFAEALFDSPPVLSFGLYFGDDRKPSNFEARMWSLVDRACELQQGGCSLEEHGCTHPFVQFLALFDHFKWSKHYARDAGRQKLNAFLVGLPHDDSACFLRILATKKAASFPLDQNSRSDMEAEARKLTKEWIASRTSNPGNLRAVVRLIATDWPNHGKSFAGLFEDGIPQGADPWFAERLAAEIANQESNVLENRLWRGEIPSAGEREAARVEMTSKCRQELEHLSKCQEMHPEIPETATKSFDVLNFIGGSRHELEIWLAKALEAEIDNSETWRRCLELYCQDSDRKALAMACLKTRRFDLGLPMVYVRDVIDNAPSTDALRFKSYYSKPNRYRNMAMVARKMHSGGMGHPFDASKLRQIMPVVCHINGDYEEAETFWREFGLALDWDELRSSILDWPDFPDKEETLVALDLLSGTTNAAVLAVERLRSSGKTNDLASAAQALLVGRHGALSAQETKYLLRLVGRVDAQKSLASGEWVECPFSVRGTVPFWTRVSLKDNASKVSDRIVGEGGSARCGDAPEKESVYFLALPARCEFKARVAPLAAEPNDVAGGGKKSVFYLLFGKYQRTVRTGKYTTKVYFGEDYLGIGLSFLNGTNTIKVSAGILEGMGGRRFDKLNEDDADIAMLPHEPGEPVNLTVRMDNGDVSVFVGQNPQEPALVRTNIYRNVRRPENKIGILGERFKIDDIRYRAMQNKVSETPPLAN